LGQLKGKGDQFGILDVGGNCVGLACFSAYELVMRMYAIDLYRLCRASTSFEAKGNSILTNKLN
jgi:hypothetical protein